MGATCPAYIVPLVLEDLIIFRVQQNIRRLYLCGFFPFCCYFLSVNLKNNHPTYALNILSHRISILLNVSFQLCFTAKCTWDWVNSHCSYAFRSIVLPITVEFHFFRINQDGQPSGYAESPGNWIFFENRLHWQFQVRLLLFTVCTFV